MRRHIIIFICGILTGIFIGVCIMHLNQPAASRQDNSKEILDNIFNEWTAPQLTGSVIQAGVKTKSRGIFRVGYMPDTVRVLSSRVEILYHIPKGVTCAQFIIESKWGISDLGVNNYFGHTYLAVKQYMQNPKYVWRTDRRYVHGVLTPVQVRFAHYQNIAECFDVHGKYLSQSRLYKAAFEKNSPEEFADEIAKYYAEDKDYSLKLKSIMNRYKLND